MGQSRSRVRHARRLSQHNGVDDGKATHWSYAAPFLPHYPTIKRMSGGRLWRGAMWMVLGAAALGGVAFGPLFWRVRTTLAELRKAEDIPGNIGVDDHPFVPAATRALPLSPSTSFTDAQVFQGNLYLAGPFGVTAYDSQFRV